jgi:hypothetical protein
MDSVRNSHDSETVWDGHRTRDRLTVGGFLGRKWTGYHMANEDERGSPGLGAAGGDACRIVTHRLAAKYRINLKVCIPRVLSYRIARRLDS